MRLSGARGVYAAAYDPQSARVARAAKARATTTPLKEGQVRCPRCRKGVRFRVEGPLAGTLYAHKDEGVPCLMGTPANVTGIEPVLVNLDELIEAALKEPVYTDAAV